MRKMSNQSDAPNQAPRTVQDVIRRIEEQCVDGTYLFRGEPKRHEADPYYGKVSSTLWRKYREEAEYCDIEAIQNEMLIGAKKHLGHVPQDVRQDFTTVIDVSKESTDDAANFEILTEIQHYGGATNLIDFTTDYFIALFFACDGFPYEDGRVVIQEIQSIKNMIRHPNNPRHRVIAQKSVFLRPPKGFIEPHEDDIVIIPPEIKHPLLQHLRKYHGISTETIYNDLHGYIIHQGIHEGAYTRFYRAFACQNRADKETNLKSKQEEYEKAIKHYSKSVELKPDFIAAYDNRGIAYENIGTHASAIKDFTTALELNPQEAGAYNNRGIAYQHIGEIECAIEDLSRALQLNPNLVEPYYNRGNAYRANKQYDDAIRDFSKAIELKPDYVYAYHSRGFAFRDKGDNARAIDDFTRAIEIEPDDTTGYVNRGVEYGKKADYVRAIKDFDKAIQWNPNLAQAYDNRGIAYGRVGNFRRAIEDYNKAIELKPDCANAVFNRGVAYLDTGDYSGAIGDFNRAIELNPDGAKGYLNRGLARLGLGEWDSGKSDLTTAKELGMDIVIEFRNIYGSITNFELKTGIRLPADIATMLTLPEA